MYPAHPRGPTVTLPVLRDCSSTGGVTAKTVRGDMAARQACRDAVARNDLEVIPVRAGEAVDLITGLRSATDLVSPSRPDAEGAITRAGRGLQLWLARCSKAECRQNS